MSQVISFLSQKGGAGKSTLARLMACEYAANDWDVKIADMDTGQGTSAVWHRKRLANEAEPRIALESFNRISVALSQRENYDLMIFDGRPASDRETLEIARESDVIVLPTNYTDDCLEPQVALAKELIHKGIPHEKFIFAFVNVPKNENQLEKSLRLIRDRAGFDAINIPLIGLVGYSEAQDSGYSVSETRFKSLNERSFEIAQGIMNKMSSVVESEEEVEGAA